MESLENWKLLLGMIATVVGALWSAFVYFDRKRLPAKADERPEAGPQIGARQGIAAGGNVSARRVTISALPPGAVVVLLAGLALVGWSVLAAGDRASGEATAGLCGTAVVGSITASSIEKNCSTE